MPTSIHVPEQLLAAVDRKARALRISRNQLIVKALEKAMEPGSDWSPGFLERLTPVDDETARLVDDMLLAIRSARRSKRPKAP